MSRTMRAAEIMLEDGGWFTAAKLGKLMGEHSKTVSGLLCCIRKCPKYITEETPLPGRKIRVLSIRDREFTTQALWRLALFGVKQG